MTMCHEVSDEKRETTFARVWSAPDQICFQNGTRMLAETNLDSNR